MSGGGNHEKPVTDLMKPGLCRAAFQALQQASIRSSTVSITRLARKRRRRSSCQGVQKSLQPAQEEAEVVAGGGQDRIAAVAVAALEIIAAHAAFGLGVADDRFDGGAALHLAADRSGHAADLAGDPDPELLGVIVAAV